MTSVPSTESITFTEIYLIVHTHFEMQCRLQHMWPNVEIIPLLVAIDRPVKVPLDVLEDRLLGAVDIEKSVTTGKTVFYSYFFQMSRASNVFVFGFFEDHCQHKL